MQFQRQRMRCDGFGFVETELYSSTSSEEVESSCQRRLPIRNEQIRTSQTGFRYIGDYSIINIIVI